MRSIPFLVLALILAGCADPDPGTTQTPTSGDMGSMADMTSSPGDMPEELDQAAPDMAPGDMASAPDMTSPQDMPAPEDEGPDCTCTGETECCDGCDPINASAACDDGLECTLGTTCQDDGTCGASTGSPCDAQLEHPDCQIAMCDEVAGCQVMNAREGFACSTPSPGTYEGLCESGVCVGQKQCECSEVDGPCCDGCLLQPMGHVCDQAGATIGCDGACDGDIVTKRISYTCDGSTLECGTTPVLIEESRQPCPSSNRCIEGETSQDTRCEPDNTCN